MTIFQIQISPNSNGFKYNMLRRPNDKFQLNRADCLPANAGDIPFAVVHAHSLARIKVNRPLQHGAWPQITVIFTQETSSGQRREHALSMQIAAGRTVSEVEVDEFLTGQRRSQPGFIEPSFPTIAGEENLFSSPHSFRGIPVEAQSKAQKLGFMHRCGSQWSNHPLQGRARDRWNGG